MSGKVLLVAAFLTCINVFASPDAGVDYTNDAGVSNNEPTYEEFLRQARKCSSVDECYEFCKDGLEADKVSASACINYMHYYRVSSIRPNYWLDEEKEIQAALVICRKGPAGKENTYTSILTNRIKNLNRMQILKIRRTKDGLREDLTPDDLAQIQQELDILNYERAMRTSCLEGINATYLDLKKDAQP